jgi:hypothetical protein
MTAQTVRKSNLNIDKAELPGSTAAMSASSSASFAVDHKWLTSCPEHLMQSTAHLAQHARFHLPKVGDFKSTRFWK